MKTLRKRTRTRRNTRKRRNSKSKQYGGGPRDDALIELGSISIRRLLQIRSKLEEAREYTLGYKITQAKELLEEVSEALHEPPVAEPVVNNQQLIQGAPAA
jgi:hypothetical protein